MDSSSPTEEAVMFLYTKTIFTEPLLTKGTELNLKLVKDEKGQQLRTFESSLINPPYN